MTQPPPPPIAPKATNANGVEVIPKTAAQQKRSALYTWIAALGIGLPWVCGLFVKIEPQLKQLFPKHAEVIGLISQIVGTVGIAMLASQRSGSANDAQRVNFSGGGG